MPKAMPNLSNGLQASNATPSDMHEDLFSFYALRINAGKAFANLLKMETIMAGSSGRTTMASALCFTSHSWNF